MDLSEMKWDKIPAEVEFNPKFIKPDYVLPVFQATFSEHPGPGQSVRICVSCDNLFPLEFCPNCGNDGFVPGFGSERVLGLFCHKCEKGFSRWKCPNCGTSNPINRSLAKRKSGCFIASVVYNSEASPSVLTLKSFRDDYLLVNWFGKLFVNIYYKISPPLSSWLTTRNIFKACIRRVILDPMVKYINARYYENQKNRK
ncbi:MAG: hypothetical protein KOO63_10825 [Bacteroidales bacterium]|nr:hypothetical protein [Candidatus Latescibacterota bacterium]